MISGSFGGLPNHLSDSRIISSAEDSVLGIDVDVISADVLGVAAMLLLVFLGL